MVHLAHILDELERNAAIFEALLLDLPTELVQWRPAPDKWNILEIVCHLRDEERDDFRKRVHQTLTDPSVAPPSIDPEGWVKARQYAEQEYALVLESFADARRASVTWLRALDHPQWTNTWQHPQLGPLSAESFLNNWLAHDYLHIRQILQRKFGYLQQVSGNDLSYAGEW
ncbi:MAG TPA: DinB family protein [Bacteroidia bacterium]|nr:DinB family protein [Bacteroidia bacterium]